jgi:hypothetical protein
MNVPLIQLFPNATILFEQKTLPGIRCQLNDQIITASCPRTSRIEQLRNAIATQLNQDLNTIQLGKRDPEGFELLCPLSFDDLVIQKVFKENEIVLVKITTGMKRDPPFQRVTSIQEQAQLSYYMFENQRTLVFVDLQDTWSNVLKEIAWNLDLPELKPNQYQISFRYPGTQKDFILLPKYLGVQISKLSKGIPVIKLKKKVNG